MSHMSATRYFAALHEEEYAVAGNVLAQTISVAKGPVPIKMPTSMFDSLRKLNLPVEIKNGASTSTPAHARARASNALCGGCP